MDNTNTGSNLSATGSGIMSSSIPPSLGSLNTSTGGDLTVGKYQKLAAEYAKMRAQNAVLKKAVLEEQGKNLAIKDELQVKEQNLRKADQEMDSLSFRNTQLQKRVGFLQDELSVALAKGKQSKGKGSNSNQQPQQCDTSPVFDYELLSKIEENIQLHKQISEMEENYGKEIRELKYLLEEKANDSALLSLQEKIDDLTSSKLTLSYTLQNTLDEIEAYKEQVNQLQEKIRNLSSEFDSNSTLQCQRGGDFSSTSQVNEMLLLTSPQLSTDNIPNLVMKLTNAEQLKEHWQLEFQLLKMKYNKIFMKWEEAKQILKSLGKEDLMSGEITPSTETVQSFTTMIGKIDVISDDPQAWGRSYEREVKEYLTSRINDLIGLLQLADSKAITFHMECTSLTRVLQLVTQKRKEVELSLKEAEKKYSESQEELNVTKENYEAQLSTMTEHLANMNEKLAIQEESIEHLKYQLNSSSSSNPSHTSKSSHSTTLKQKK